MNTSKNLVLLLSCLFLFSCHFDDSKNTYTIKGKVGNGYEIFDPFLTDSLLTTKYITRVNLISGDQIIASTTDDEFEFTNLEEGKSYMVVPQSIKKGFMGTTAIDFVIIRKYTEGIDELNTWQKKMAADVNLDNHINQADLELVYGCLLNTPCTATTFRFVTENFDGNGVGFIDQFPIPHLNANTTVNFLPIALGDVNRSF